MANYPCLIFTDEISTYWHDFTFATSGEVIAHVDSMMISGDIFQKKDPDGSGSDCYYRVSPYSIKVVKVFLN